MKRIVVLSLLITPFLVACGLTQKEKMTKKTVMNSVKNELKVFPNAEEGYIRHVFFLPKLSEAEEAKRKVEIFAGKVVLVDCNTYGLMGTIEKDEVKGYGYNYYTLQTNGNIFSTMMACPDDTKKKEFVSASPIMIAYNSKLPLVVYTPKGYEARYKIWKAGKLRQE